MTVRARLLSRWAWCMVIDRFPQGTVYRFWIGRLLVTWRVPA